ncbi:hypothetical protein [Jannaschia sp. R86511]|uniref:hypothetical protein n=1 Tax=Jannaschia sp. R86511 TaxID=3093853 RepID=UPI0036D320F8
MTPRTSTRASGARTGAVVGAVVLSLGLSACSAAGRPGAAAVVDGRVVAEADVQAAVSELPLEITQGTRVDPVQIVSLLVAADAVEAVAREFTEQSPADLFATDEDAQEFLDAVDVEAGRGPQEYSEATLQVIATNLMLSNLQQTDVAAPALQEAITGLQDADVSINPRYGTVGEQGELQFGDFRRDWLPETATDAQATPQG